jgi:hypothetical protein
MRSTKATTAPVFTYLLRWLCVIKMFCKLPTRLGEPESGPPAADECLLGFSNGSNGSDTSRLTPYGKDTDLRRGVVDPKGM